MTPFPRRRIRRTRQGEFEIRLPESERRVLASLVPQLRELLVMGGDPSLRRLYPTAYPDDAERDAEYQRLMGDELLRRRLDALDVLEETLGADRLDEQQLVVCMGAINDLRLVLGTRLDVSEGTELALDPDDPDGPLLAVYVYLGWLLEQVVAALDPG
ncbi:MAG: DUF2017 family protein [Acidimicrobiales bacterium]|nr:DUF2017 family protein [Acidimicrobiales bacterium]